MARLAGVDIPRDKRVEVALTYIYGVGRTRALKVLADTEISGEIRVKDLTDDQLDRPSRLHRGQLQGRG